MNDPTATLQTPDGKYTISTSITLTPPPPVVVPPPPPPVSLEPVIPSTATIVDLLPSVIAWAENHDAGTPGSSVGTTTYPVTAPDGTTCREFQFTDTGKGGEIYHVDALKDSSAYNTFCYETVESSPDWSNVACAEKDLEHADPTGTYVDMATQLDAHSNAVDVTGSHHWMTTAIKADPSKRAPNVLHTTRIYVRDNGDGTVNYLGIFLDGTFTPFVGESSVASVGSKKWGKNILNLQLQYDGASANSVQTTIYMHTLRVHAWKS